MGPIFLDQGADLGKELPQPPSGPSHPLGMALGGLRQPSGWQDMGVLKGASLQRGASQGGLQVDWPTEGSVAPRSHQGEEQVG